MATIMRNMINKHDSFSDLDKKKGLGTGQSENYVYDMGRSIRLWNDMGKSGKKDTSKLETYFKTEQVNDKS